MDSVLCERDIPNAGHQTTASDAPDSAALRGIGYGKLLAGSLGFVLLAVGIFWYQFHRIHVGDQAPQWDQLQWRYFFPISMCLPLETISSGLRIWLICRVLQSRVGLWACFKAEWANVAIAMLTPSQSSGGPGEIYLLSRHPKDHIRVGVSFEPGLPFLACAHVLPLSSLPRYQHLDVSSGHRGAGGPYFPRLLCTDTRGRGRGRSRLAKIMEDIVPVGFTPYCTLLWRSLTLYLTAVAGLLCLAHALAQDARQAIRRVR